METLWDRNIDITTQLVDTARIPMLIKTAAAKTIEPARLISPHFTLYETFRNAARTNALKVLISPTRRWRTDLKHGGCVNGPLD